MTINKIYNLAFLVITLLLFAVCSGCIQHFKWFFSDIQDCVPEKREFSFDVNETIRMEWREFFPVRVYVPCDLSLRDYCIHEECLVAYTPCNYCITIIDLGDENYMIDKRLSFYNCCKSDFKWNMSSYEVTMLRYTIGFKQLLGLDWYTINTFTDRRLLMEHMSVNENCEYLNCYCELNNGKCIFLNLQSNGRIEKGAIEYMWNLGRLFEIYNTFDNETLPTH